jgi:hypothetical protein
MESLSKAKNLILGLLLGMAVAIAIPYAQPSAKVQVPVSEESELRASAPVQVPVSEEAVRRAIESCLHGARVFGVPGDMIITVNRPFCTGI